MFLTVIYKKFEFSFVLNYDFSNFLMKITYKVIFRANIHFQKCYKIEHNINPLCNSKYPIKITVLLYNFFVL